MSELLFIIGNRSAISRAAHWRIVSILVAVIAGGELRAATFSSDPILKFDVGPVNQKVFPGFMAVGPETTYAAKSGYGWLITPKYFTAFRKWPAFPDALTCDLAAPSAPLTKEASGYRGAFEFRVDLPKGNYRVAVMSGNYEYLPSQIETFAIDLERNAYRVPASERIAANGQLVWRHDFTNDDLVHEFYHDLNTELRRGMTLWDRTISSRFPARIFDADASDSKLILRFENMPVNAIMLWPAAREQAGQAFLVHLNEERRSSFPAKDLTPTPENTMPPLPYDAESNGYFFFVPHWSDTIYPTTIPRPEWIKPEAQVSAAPGQFESFTVGVYPLRDLAECSVSVSDLQTSNGARLSASTVDVRVLRYMELQAGTSAAYETTAYLPLKWGPIALDKSMPRIWWLTARIPESAQPGEYFGNITFHANDAPMSQLKLKLHVLPFKLRPLKDRFHALFHDYYQFPGGGLDRRVQWQRDTGFNVITGAAPISGLRFENGRLSPPDLSNWETFLNTYRRNGFPMQLIVSQGALFAAYRATGERFTEREFKGAHQVKDSFSPAFEDCYKQLARTMTEDFKRRGWPDIVFYDIGEAANEGPRGVRTETHLMRLLHEAGVKNTTSISGESAALSLRDSVPQMYVTLLGKVNPENAQKVWEAGSLLGIYGAETRFQRGFWFWRTGAILCGEEGGVALYGNPYDPFDGSRSRDWGDVYPTPDGPTASVHTIAKREGIDDSRYLFQLENLIAEAQKRKSIKAHTEATAAQKMLDEIKHHISVDYDDYRTVMEEPPGPVLDNLRQVVSMHIEQITEVLRMEGH